MSIGRASEAEQGKQVRLPLLAILVTALVVVDVEKQVGQRIAGLVAEVDERRNEGRVAADVLEIEKQWRHHRMAVVTVLSKEGQGRHGCAEAAQVAAVVEKRSDPQRLADAVALLERKER